MPRCAFCSYIGPSVELRRATRVLDIPVERWFCKDKPACKRRAEKKAAA